MTTSQIIAAIACVAALGAVMSYRARRTAERTLPVRGGDGVITFPRHMSDAEVEAFKARWQAAHKPGCAHPVEPLKEGEACSAYQPPTTAEMTGLCARCGMYDYKHQEQHDA